MRHGWAVIAPSGVMVEVYEGGTQERCIEGFLLLFGVFSSLKESKRARKMWRRHFREGYRCVPIEIRVVVPGESSLAANLHPSRN